MRQQILIFILLVVVGVASVTPATADGRDTLYKSSIADVRLNYGWLRSENGASLDVVGNVRTSMAEIYGTTEQGKLIDHNGSDNQYEAEFRAESLVRLSERVALYGRVGYLNFLGNNMAGSYLIDPASAPFDILELTNENRGRKQLERYEVEGTVALRILSWLSAGVCFDYEAANYSKRKDLRHTNTMMDLTATAGLKFRLGNKVQLGANYTYRRRNESLLLSMYGTTDKTYQSLVNYGGMFGKMEFFSDNGYTKKNETKPLFDSYHGGAVQLSWQITPNIEWFNEVGFRTRKGYYGDASPYTVVYANHDGRDMHYCGVLTITSRRTRHTVDVEWQRTKVNNRENIYEYRTEEGGLSYINYLGEVETGNRTDQSLKAGYTIRIDEERKIAKWQVGAAIALNTRNSLANSYPDYRHQNISWWRAEATAKRNIQHLRNIFTIALDAGYGAGWGEPFVDGSFVGSGSSQSYVRRLDDVARLETEYLTSPQMRSGIELGYGRHLGLRGVVGYITLDYTYCQAFDCEIIEKPHRHLVELSVGCRF